VSSCQVLLVCSELFRRCTLALWPDQVPKAVDSVARGGLALFIRCVEIKRTAVVRKLQVPVRALRGSYFSFHTLFRTEIIVGSNDVRGPANRAFVIAGRLCTLVPRVCVYGHSGVAEEELAASRTVDTKGEIIPNDGLLRSCLPHRACVGLRSELPPARQCKQ
jgi:hypothetical protein